MTSAAKANRNAEIVDRLEAEIERLRAGLDAAIRAANLALFVINKAGVMPNSSWEGGFKSDLAVAKAARDPLNIQQSSGKRTE